MKPKYQVHNRKDDILEIKLVGVENSYLRLQKLTDKVYCAITTFVDPNTRGEGVGKKLYEALIDYVKTNDAKFKATCPFVVELAQQDKINKNRYITE
jgi:predicted GNAT family acetyltransferase